MGDGNRGTIDCRLTLDFFFVKISVKKILFLAFTLAQYLPKITFSMENAGFNDRSLNLFIRPRLIDICFDFGTFSLIITRAGWKRGDSFSPWEKTNLVEKLKMKRVSKNVSSCL